jgi:hypothetical protein
MTAETITSTKDRLRDALTAEFDSGQPGVQEAIDRAVDTANRHLGDIRTYDDFLGCWIIATVI